MKKLFKSLGRGYKPTGPRAVNVVKTLSGENSIPTEHQEQQAVVSWCESQYGPHSIFAIPNSAKMSIPAAMYYRAEGRRSGVPDLFIPGKHGPFLGLFIEMKRVKGGRVSDEQSAWIESLTRHGYAVHVCEGFEKAKEIILEYKGEFKP